MSDVLPMAQAGDDAHPAGATIGGASVCGKLLPLDVAGDLNAVDGSEQVTLRQPGGSASIVIDGALRRHVGASGSPGETREAAPSAGIHTASDVVWHLPVEALCTMPELGATITDGEGVDWTVLEVSRETLGTRWRCRTRALAIAAGLDQLITIEQAVWTKDAAGAAHAKWKTWREGVRARIQPVSGDIDQQHAMRHTRTTHRVYLAERIELDENKRIVAADGRTYHVLGFEMPERIDKLMVVHVEESPWPLG